MIDNLKPSKKVQLSQSKISEAGRGLFATVPIKKGEIIEQAPIIMLKGEAKALKSSELYNYYFITEDKESAAIALGFGSLYNHSYSPNATYEKHFHELIITFRAIKDIAADEEITVNYNYGNPDDKKQLWIKSIKPHTEN
jgi:SET domain-containing protein